MATLILTQPDGSEIDLPLEHEIIRIGRDSENDVAIDDESISTFHAEIVVADGHHVLKDLGSTNGVRVNGERVHDAPLADGDLLRFGNVRARYAGAGPVIRAEAEALPPPAAATSGLAAAPMASGPKPMGFGPKKAAKDPEKAIYILVGSLVGVAGLAAMLMSFTM